MLLTSFNYFHFDTAEHFEIHMLDSIIPVNNQVLNLLVIISVKFSKHFILNSQNSKLAQMIMLMTCVFEALILSPDQDANHPDKFLMALLSPSRQMSGEYL
jgi:hypothetical protein